MYLLNRLVYEPNFRLVVGVHASFLPAERRTHGTCGGVRPVHAVLTNEKFFICSNQQGVSVLHGYGLFNLEFSGLNLVLLYHHTTACALAGFIFAFVLSGR